MKLGLFCKLQNTFTKWPQKSQISNNLLLLSYLLQSYFVLNIHVTLEIIVEQANIQIHPNNKQIWYFIFLNTEELADSNYWLLRKILLLKLLKNCFRCFSFLISDIIRLLSTLINRCIYNFQYTYFKINYSCVCRSRVETLLLYR